MEKMTHIELSDIQCQDVKARSFDVNASSIVFQVVLDAKQLQECSSVFSQTGLGKQCRPRSDDP